MYRVSGKACVSISALLSVKEQQFHLLFNLFNNFWCWNIVIVILGLGDKIIFIIYMIKSSTIAMINESHSRNTVFHWCMFQAATTQNDVDPSVSSLDKKWAVQLAKPSRRKVQKKDEEIVPKTGHTTLVIWKWVGYLNSNKAQTSIRCEICKQPVLNRTGNTTNIFHHLEWYHPKQYFRSMSLCYYASISLHSSNSPAPLLY